MILGFFATAQPPSRQDLNSQSRDFCATFTTVENKILGLTTTPHEIWPPVNRPIVLDFIHFWTKSRTVLT